MELTPRLYHYFVRPKWFSYKFYNTLFQNAFNFKRKNILDFGCGIGSASRLFEPKYYVGVDLDRRRIEYAKKIYPGYNFLEMQDAQLPIQENSIDFILIMSVLHHIPSEMLPDYLNSFRRILKPKGSIIVAEPCFYKNAYLSNWYMTNFDRGKYIRTEEKYLGLFENANYEIKYLRKCKHNIFYNKVVFSASPSE